MHNGHIVARPKYSLPPSFAKFARDVGINLFPEREEVSRPSGALAEDELRNWAGHRFSVDKKGRFKFHSSKIVSQLTPPQIENYNKYRNNSINPDEDGVYFQGQRAINNEWFPRFHPKLVDLWE
jgi:hypothetical protein